MPITDQEITEYAAAIKGSPVKMCGNMVTCPDPGHPDDVTPSCLVNRQTGDFFCYGCWAHGKIGKPWNPAMRWTPPPPPKESESRQTNERWVPSRGC